jgi:hypothetical protein
MCFAVDETKYDALENTSQSNLELFRKGHRRRVQAIRMNLYHSPVQHIACQYSRGLGSPAVDSTTIADSVKWVSNISGGWAPHAPRNKPGRSLQHPKQLIPWATKDRLGVRQENVSCLLSLRLELHIYLLHRTAELTHNGRRASSATLPDVPAIVAGTNNVVPI